MQSDRDKENTSSSLLDRLRSPDDHEAWLRVTELYGPLVYYWCRKAQLPPTTSADLVQEVFVSVARAIGRFSQSETGSFRGWLATITRNKIRDYFRTAATQPVAHGGSSFQALLENFPEASGDSGLQSEGSCERRELQCILQQALRALEVDFEPVTWQAFLLTTAQGQQPACVAEQLQISVNAVYKAKSRVLRRLRDELAGLEF